MYHESFNFTYLFLFLASEFGLLYISVLWKLNFLIPEGENRKRLSYKWLRYFRETYLEKCSTVGGRKTSKFLSVSDRYSDVIAQIQAVLWSWVLSQTAEEQSTFLSCLKCYSCVKNSFFIRPKSKLGRIWPIYFFYNCES